MSMPVKATDRLQDPEQQQEGRIIKRRRATRAKLLEAAYDVMAEVGVDAAKIKDITDLADVGFGTFYNYFDSKDQLAKEVLDCLIHNCGIRYTSETEKLSTTDFPAVMPVSIRLFVREAASTPIWRWWAQRPDLLVDRVRNGFAEFAKRDITQGIIRGFLSLPRADVDQAWGIVCWMMVGGIHDIVMGDRPLDSEVFVADTIVRALGYDRDTARRVAQVVLPGLDAVGIDWTFKLDDGRSMPLHACLPTVTPQLVAQR